MCAVVKAPSEVVYKAHQYFPEVLRAVHVWVYLHLVVVEERQKQGKTANATDPRVKKVGKDCQLLQYQINRPQSRIHTQEFMDQT